MTLQEHGDKPSGYHREAKVVSGFPDIEESWGGASMALEVINKDGVLARKKSKQRALNHQRICLEPGI